MELGLNTGEEDPDMSYEAYVNQYGKSKTPTACEVNCYEILTLLTKHIVFLSKIDYNGSSIQNW